MSISRFFPLNDLFDTPSDGPDDSVQTPLNDTASAIVLFCLAVAAVDSLISGLRMTGIIGVAFIRLPKWFSLTVIMLIFATVRVGTLPLLASLLPQYIPSYSPYRSLITGVMLLFGLLASLKSLLQLILVVYGVFSTKPFQPMITKHPLTELRRKIQKRIQHKRMPHLVVVIVVTQAYKSGIQVIAAIKAILNSVYPERFLSIHLIFDYIEASPVYNEVITFLRRNESPGPSPTFPTERVNVVYEKVEFLISKQETVGLCHAQAGALKEISFMYKGHERNLCVVLMDPCVLVSKDCFVHLIRALEKQKDVVGMTGYIHYTDEKDESSAAVKSLHVVAEQNQALHRAIESACGNAAYTPSPLTLVRLHRVMPIVEAYLDQPVKKVLGLHAYLSFQSFLDVALVNYGKIAAVGFCPIATANFRAPSSDLHYWTLFLRPLSLHVYQLTNWRLWARSFSHQLIKLIDVIHYIPGFIFAPLFAYGVNGANVWEIIWLMFTMPMLIRMVLLLVIGSTSHSSLPLRPWTGPFYSAVASLFSVYMSVYESMGTREWIWNAELGLESLQNGDIENSKIKLFPHLSVSQDAPLSPNDYPYRSTGTDSDRSDEDDKSPIKDILPASFKFTLGVSDVSATKGKSHSDSSQSASNTPSMSHTGFTHHTVTMSNSSLVGDDVSASPRMSHSRSFSNLNSSLNNMISGAASKLSRSPSVSMKRGGSVKRSTPSLNPMNAAHSHGSS